MGGTNDRERRLAEALRANLRRRKAQARGAPSPRETPGVEDASADDPPADDPITTAR